jgi:hypothetical protein
MVLRQPKTISNKPEIISREKMPWYGPFPSRVTNCCRVAGAIDGKRWTNIQMDKPDINIAIADSSFKHGIKRDDFGIKHRIRSNAFSVLYIIR